MLLLLQCAGSKCLGYMSGQNEDPLGSLGTFIFYCSTIHTHPIRWYPPILPLSPKCLHDNPRHVHFRPLKLLITFTPDLTIIYCLVLFFDYSFRLASRKLLKLFHTRNWVWFTVVQAPSMLPAHFLRIMLSTLQMLIKYVLMQLYLSST